MNISFSTTKICIALLCSLFFSLPSLAIESADGLWSDIAHNRIPVRGMRATVPDRYRTVQVDRLKLEQQLSRAPLERSAEVGAELWLPMPDGSFQLFLVENSPILAPDLAKAYPKINTFLAVAKDNTVISARLDLTPAGFHAIIFTLNGTVYIDPYQMDSDREYMVYYKRTFNKNREPFRCSFTGEKVDAAHSPLDHVRTPVGDSLRTYRLAVAATGEYTSFHGGSVAAGLAAITTTINRVTGIYERELSIRLSLVGNNNLIVYTNPATDPYTNTNPGLLLSQNQSNLDAVIGSANYDVGHVFGTGGGGLAGLGVVCNTSSKAQGETGSGTPVGDPFDVDFVAHELGHQFGGNHTFNGTTGNCGGGNRNGSTAYEPGSGTTIQAYAGICGAENIQSNSDDNFHAISFAEMNSYVSGPGNCSSNSATGNTAPTVDAGAAAVMPVGTPLFLREGAVSDPDAGQFLTYSWEQFDLGAASPPNTDNGNRPIFRSFPPQFASVRYLPQMSDILGGSSTLGESLPSTNRALTFRLTVRDNAAGGGGVDHDTVVHTTTTSAGPFVVTSQSTPQTWTAGSTQTVSWNVANTNSVPVNCSVVDIVYSNSGFANFSGTTIASSTANDGSHNIIVPNVQGPNGRVMVVCLSNHFFNINSANITIIGSVCGNSILDGGEQCDDGNSLPGDGCDSSCQIESGYTCSAPIPPTPGGEVFPDGGFEGGSPNAVWTETSTNFGTPLCTDAGCGITGGPNNGLWFAWFGGIAALETGTLDQSFVFENGDSVLTFARRLAGCDSAVDFVRLAIDNTEVWLADGSHSDCGQPAYTIETIDLATATGGPYNDGNLHAIRIESSIFAANGGSSNFFIDDVSLIRGGSPAIPSMCSLSSPDTDGDGVTDNLDNCTLIMNADQRDTNLDGYGNVCDPDLDNNGVVNFGDVSAWVPFFNTTCGDVDEDFNGDGNCNFGDYSSFPAFFQQAPGPSGIAP